MQPHRPGGLYDFRCLQCCARLIATARPLKGAQLAMLAAIARTPGAPTRQAVLDAVKALASAPPAPLPPPPGLGPSPNP